MEDLAHGEQQGHTDGAPAHQHDQHGRHGLAQAAHDRGGGMGEAQQAIEQRADGGAARAIADNLGIGIEEGNQDGRAEPGQDPQPQQQDGGTAQAKLRPLPHAIHAPGAHVLGDKGGERHGEGRDRQEHEALDLQAGADARHGVPAKAVDIGLDEHVGQVDDAALHGRGEPIAQDKAEAVQVKGDPAGLQTDDLPGAQQTNRHQDQAQYFGQHGGQGRALHIHVEKGHEHHVQHDIDQRAGHQAQQREAALPRGLQDADQHIVHDQGKGAGEKDPQIGGRAADDAVRRAHQPQDGRADQDAHSRQQQAEHQPQGNGSMHSPAGVFRVARADMPGDDDPRAGGKARHKADEEIHIRGGGGHRRQGVRVQKVPHDQRVHRVVQLLEKISAQNGQGKPQDPAPRAAFRHQIELRHAVPPLYFKKARSPRCAVSAPCMIAQPGAIFNVRRGLYENPIKTLHPKTEIGRGRGTGERAF